MNLSHINNWNWSVEHQIKVIDIQTIETQLEKEASIPKFLPKANFKNRFTELFIYKKI